MAKSDMSQSESSEEDPGPAVQSSRSDQKSISDSLCVIPTPHTISTPVSILIESLVKNICNIFESDSKKAASIYKLICDKLFKMNIIDESYTMQEFEGMRNQYQRAFLQLLTSTIGAEKMLRPIWPTTDITNSHYMREFDEIEYIAGGGFGQVYRVRHKLDGVEYAVKKIPIRSEGIDSVRNYLSEVKTFSSINHTNIVQYKAAWLEIGAPAGNHVITDESSTFSSSLTNTSRSNNDHVDIDEYVYHKIGSHSFSETEKDDTDFEIDFKHSISNTFQHTTHSSKRLVRERKESVSEGGQVVCTLSMKELKKIRSKQRTEAKWATLYIQMSLCQSTLKHWLERRNETEIPVNPNVALVPVNGQIVRNQTVFEILGQLLKGLEYIHSKGIVHHDIKPSNIFIQIDNGNISVQLGDFGLACPLQSVRHSLAFGTKLYAAPEQLEGKCDRKSDLYSVGIVLLELVESFRTDMERVQNITELRKGNLSSKVLLEQPQTAQIISQLTLKNYQKRPDSSELLKTITLKSSESEQIDMLKSQLAEKDVEIMHLKELLKTHGIKSV